MTTPPPWGPQSTEFGADEHLVKARIAEGGESLRNRARGLNSLALLGVAILVAFAVGLGWRLAQWLFGFL